MMFKFLNKTECIYSVPGSSEGLNIKKGGTAYIVYSPFIRDYTDRGFFMFRKEKFIMAKELEKNYNPADIEKRTYDKWLEKKYFHAEVDRDKKPFTIVMPPPNITGQLHMGHALDNTLQDILIRFKRMQGYEALWVPGTDHASIATEAKVVEKLAKDGIKKEDIGREKFLEHVWDWKKQYGGRIVEQLKKIGSSCDWDRERFTMDEGSFRHS